MKNLLRVLLKNLAAILIAGSCVSQAIAQIGSSVDCVEPNGASFVGDKSQNADSVIVFVHGLGGNAVDTWKKGWFYTNYWPCLVKSDEIFSGSNVFAYEYPTSILSGETSVENIASRLFLDLNAAGIFNYKHVSIVAHSLGGLVVSEMLLQLNKSSGSLHSRALSKVRQTLFYGVPSAGSDLAALARLFGASKQIKDLANYESNSKILQRWLSVRWSFSITCLSETVGEGVPLFRYLVVPDKNAFAYCGESKEINKFHLDGYSHRDMVKPENRNSDPYRRFAADYLLCVKPLLVKVTRPVVEKFKLKLNSWYDSFILTLIENDINLTSKVARLVNLPNPGAGFLVPMSVKVGIDQGSFEYVRGISIINTEIFQQLRPRLIGGGNSNASILSRFYLTDINKIISDISVNDLKSSIELNSDFGVNAVAMLVGFGQGNAERVLMIFDEASADGEIFFKGFVIVSSSGVCAVDKL
jgi:pimeloyl-ACP methyl ester carboxylesterase